MKKVILAALISVFTIPAYAGEARLKWAYPVDDMRNFTVYCDSGQNESAKFTVDDGAARETVITLASGSIWSCRLTATNQFGSESDYSDPTPVDFSRPVPPTDVESTRIPVTININF